MVPGMALGTPLNGVGETPPDVRAVTSFDGVERPFALVARTRYRSGVPGMSPVFE